MLSQSDKIVLTKYPALPSKCAVCHHGSDGVLEFVDFQLSFDYEGVVVICVNCMVNVAQVLDLVPRKELSEQAQQIENLVTRCRELTLENDRLNASIDSILGIRPDLNERRMAANETVSPNTEEDAGQLLLPIGPRTPAKLPPARKNSKSNTGNAES